MTRYISLALGFFVGLNLISAGFAAERVVVGELVYTED